MELIIPVKDFLFRFVAITIGLAILAAATAGWHFWRIDGLFAFLLGCAGLVMIWHGIDPKNH